MLVYVSSDVSVRHAFMARVIFSSLNARGLKKQYDPLIYSNDASQNAKLEMKELRRYFKQPGAKVWGGGGGKRG